MKSFLGYVDIYLIIQEKKKKLLVLSVKKKKKDNLTAIKSSHCSWPDGEP